MNPADVFSDPLRREEFLALAARIFGASRGEVSPETRRGELPGWDSVNHLRLVMEAESAFGVSYPLERIPSLDSLSCFFA